jgi:predicted DNA repair protein MutK
VYGVVAVIVKMDDVGLHLTQTASRVGQKVGRGLVAAMPKLLSTLSAVGTVAMLWVGGHILLAGSDHLGWHTPYDSVHYVEDRVRHSVKAVGGVLAWLVDTGGSAVIGLIVGAIAVALMRLVSFVRQVTRRAHRGKALLLTPSRPDLDELGNRPQRNDELGSSREEGA